MQSNRLNPVATIIVDTTVQELGEVAVLDVLPNNEVLAASTSKQEVKVYPLSNLDTSAAVGK